MPNCCSVCLNNGRKYKKMSFFGYPKDLDRRRNWLIAVSREDLIERVGEYYRICEEHFEKRFITVTKNKTKKYLTDDAFPSLNLPSNTGASPSAAAQLFSQSSTDGSPHVFHQQNPVQNNANESMPMPIKLEIISDESEFNNELDAYDRFSLLISKKIKSIHSINARIRLMNAIQDMVDGFCAKNDHDPIDSSTHQTMSVPVVDGTAMVQDALLQPMESYDETHQVKQPDVIRSVHVQQLSIDPKPSSSFLPHEKKTIKTYSKRRKVMAEENPIGESYVEVPVETALPTEFVSLGLKTDAPPLHGVGEARPNVDILEIKEEKIQDEESSSLMTTANESAAASVSGITFINDPIPIKLEVVDMEEF